MGKRTDSLLIYFDSQNRFYPLDSSVLVPYRADPEHPSPPPDLERPAKVLTDGSHYFVIPERIVQSAPWQPPAEFDLEKLRRYFFTEDAKVAALNLSEEAMRSVDRGSLTYGTTGAESFFHALERIKMGAEDRFLDIGCGCGLPVLMSSYFAKEARGVDIVESVVEFAGRAAKEFGRKNVSVTLKNIRELNVADVDVAYVAATAMTEELREAIGAKLEELRPGAIVISLTFSFACNHLVLVDSFRSSFSWWDSTTTVNHQFLIHLRKAHGS